MRRILLSALLVSILALPAAAQSFHVQGVLVEPRHPTTSDRIRLTVVGPPDGCSLGIEEPFYETATDSVVLRSQVSACPPTPLPNPQPASRRAFEIGPLPAGQHFAEVRFGDAPGFNWRELFEVSADTGQLDLGQDDRFQVSVHWSNPRDGSSGSGRPRQLAQDSGAFWFFSQDNLEVTVKVLDGRTLNGHWWVFIASMTDLQLEVEIARDAGPVKTYVQAAGTNRNFIDVNAFEEGPPPPAADAALTTPEIVIAPEHPTPADPVRAEVAILNTTPVAFTGVEGHRLVFNYEHQDFPGFPPPEQRFTAETAVGPLAPGVYAVDVRTGFFNHAFGRTFEVAAPHTQLDLHQTEETYFHVFVNLDPPLKGIGYGVPLTRESGYFWFFDPDNIELTVKILDGRGVNGKYWVFISSMTDVAYTVEVERCISRSDPFGCGSVFYRSVKGVNQNVIDVDFVGNL